MSAPRRFQDEWLVRPLLQARPDLAAAVERVRGTAASFVGDELAKAGLLPASEIGGIVFRQYGVPFAEPRVEELDSVAVNLVPEKLCRQHTLIPMRLADETVCVLMADPLSPEAASDVTAVSGRPVKPHFALNEKVRRLIEEKFNPALTAAQMAQEMAQSQQAALEVVDESPEEPFPEDQDPDSGPVSTLATSLFVNAVRMRASDIHIEQEEARTVVRYRIDGHLRNIMTLPRQIGVGPLVSRIKIMGKMDVSDRRRPLDGRAKIKVEGHEIGLRISTLPTSLGEKVVVRILDKRAAEIPFEALGFRPAVRDRLRAVLDREKGLLLVTGPTGSGKTTTLYACVNYLKSESTNIVTIEDPVEYKLDGINQVQINDKSGLGFSAVLRSVLRQDPDVVLLGEMRDKETALIAFQASNTGHFVLSTLHSNDSIATVTRLVQMGLDAYEVASPLAAVTSQRLIRRVCPNCRAETPGAKLPPGLAARAERLGLRPALVKGAGCVQCGQTGYKGRVVVTEVLVVEQDVKGMITADVPETTMRRDCLSRGFLLDPVDDVTCHLCEGQTSLDEVLGFLGGDAPPLDAAPPAPAVVPAPVVPAAAPVTAGALPSAPERQGGADATASDAQAKPPPKDILVVDDEESIRVLLRRILQAEGYAVRAACEGSEGLRMLTERMPDLLITDLNMPVLDGIGLIRAVRADLRIWNVPIVILTAVSSTASQALARQIGVDDYLIKPFDDEVLVARVGALLKRAKLRQDG